MAKMPIPNTTIENYPLRKEVWVDSHGTFFNTLEEAQQSQRNISKSMDFYKWYNKTSDFSDGIDDSGMWKWLNQHRKEILAFLDGQAV